jgi:hypothetical protein
MTKIYQLGTPPKQGLWVETYLAPPPPPQGKIIGLDCHPDTFTAAVFVRQTPHDARKVGSRENLGLQALLGWAAKELGPQDLFMLEAGSNSASSLAGGCTPPWACARWPRELPCWQARKTYADNDKMRPPPVSRWSSWPAMPRVGARRAEPPAPGELLHAYGRWCRRHHTAAGNRCGVTNGNAIRRSDQRPIACRIRKASSRNYDFVIDLRQNPTCSSTDPRSWACRRRLGERSRSLAWIEEDETLHLHGCVQHNCRHGQKGKDGQVSMKDPECG